VAVEAGAVATAAEDSRDAAARAVSMRCFKGVYLSSGSATGRAQSDRGH
jgi:hypothetical protein